MSENARAAFDQGTTGESEVFVRAIVLAEMILLAEKRRAEIDIGAVVAALESSAGFRITALSPAMVLRIRELATLRDIHDRLVVAEAIELGASLIIRDREIAASGLAPTLW